MSLIPFRKEGQISLSDLQQEMNNLFDRFWHGGLSTPPFDGQGWAPAVDVIEEPERFILRAEVPGLEAADISLTCSEGSLEIKGHKSCDYAEETRQGLLRRERRFGSFSRSIPLPGGADSSAITASCRNGVLEITMPKREDSRAKVIKIDVKE